MFAWCRSTHRLNIALVVLSLHVCFTDVMNSFPIQKKKKKKNCEKVLLPSKHIMGIICGGLNACCMQTRPLFLRTSGSSGVLKALLLERNGQLSCNPPKKISLLFAACFASQADSFCRHFVCCFTSCLVCLLLVNTQTKHCPCGSFATCVFHRCNE